MKTVAALSASPVVAAVRRVQKESAFTRRYRAEFIIQAALYAGAGERLNIIVLHGASAETNKTGLEDTPPERGDAFFELFPLGGNEKKRRKSEGQ